MGNQPAKGLNPSIRRSAIPTPRDATTFGKDKLFRERSRTLPSRKAAGPDGSDSVTPTGKPQTVSAPRAGSEGAEQSRLRIQVRELLAEAQVKELEMGRLRCELKRQQDKHRKQLPEEKWGSDNIESQLLELQEKTRGFQQEVQDPRTEKGVLQERLLSLEQLREAAESDTDGNSLSLDVSPNSDPGNSLQTPSSLDRNRTRGPDNTSMAINGVQSHSLISHTNSGTPSLHSVGCDTALDPPTIGSNGLQAIPHSSDASSEGLMKDMAEKIEQMEQKHHSTAEELQATLQELSDQQLLLQELTAENEKLLEEKRTLEVSLQQQAARQKVSQDGQRVSRGSEIGDSAEPDQDKLPVSNCWSLEQEQPGTDLLVKSLREKVRNLQLLLEAEREGNASNTETRPNCHHEYSEQANQMELENQKKEELKVGEGAAEMGMLQEVLRETQCEKERLQLECSALRETSRQNTSEIIRLHSLVVKMQVSESQGEGERETPRLSVESEIKDLKETIFELQDQVEQHQAVRLHNNSTIRELEDKLITLEEQKLKLEKQLKMSNRRLKEESEEWCRFQADLQTAVVVANDMKSEAQQAARVLRRKLQEAEGRIEQLQQELGTLNGHRPDLSQAEQRF
ncbi:cytospin-B isoform X2 [Scyliorhinus torazame]|uniref:cytospin-B isoform X2 n=1 Tax=Scyliorhinus torazame TaxID=75743 RepID=UPI003B59B312